MSRTVLILLSPFLFISTFFLVGILASDAYAQTAPITVPVVSQQSATEATVASATATTMPVAVSQPVCDPVIVQIRTEAPRPKKELSTQETPAQRPRFHRFLIAGTLLASISPNLIEGPHLFGGLSAMLESGLRFSRTNGIGVGALFDIGASSNILGEVSKKQLRFGPTLMFGRTSLVAGVSYATLERHRDRTFPEFKWLDELHRNNQSFYREAVGGFAGIVVHKYLGHRRNFAWVYRALVGSTGIAEPLYVEFATGLSFGAH